MKKSLLLLCILIASLLVITSCGGEEEPPHECSYGTEWSHDETHHWYAPTCDPTHMKLNYKEHEDADNNGACDVCAYDGGHEHEYSDEWSTDETSHWYAASCGHDVVNGKAEHTDGNNDGACDVCAWADPEHTHSHKSEWTFEGTTEADHKHLHEVACGHLGIGNKDEGGFVDEGKDGVCDVCGWLDAAHTHTHGAEWTVEGTTEADHKHYHKVTCAHTGIGNKDEGAFADKEKDGVCDTCGWSDASHTHTYANVWSSDSTYHWYAASCGHTALVSGKSAHADKDNNSECDVCGYDYNHTHTFNKNAWESDEKQHWHAATCTHTTVKDAVEDHSDNNLDGKCDVCGWFDPEHTHTYSESWSVSGTTVGDHKHWHGVSCEHTGIGISDEGRMVDENNDGQCDVCETVVCTHTFDESKLVGDLASHWYATTCGHAVPEDTKTPHTDSDADELCDVCHLAMSINKIIEAATSAETAAKVLGGTVTVDLGGSVTTYTYEFGKNYIYIKEAYSSSDYYEYWYTSFNNGKSVLGMYSVDGGTVSEYNYEYGLDNLKGPYIAGDFVKYATNFYGVEDIVYKLAYLDVEAGDNAAGVSGIAYDYDYTTDSYIITLVYNNGGADYDVTASFKLDENGVIRSLSVTTSGNESTLTLSAEQTVGERTKDSPYDPTKGLIESVVVTDPEGNIIEDGATISLDYGETLKLSVAVNPENYDPSLDVLRAESENMFAYYFVNTKILNLNGSQGYSGQTMVVKLVGKMVEYTINVEVVPPAPTSFRPQIHDIGGGTLTTESTNAYLNNAIGISAAVNYGADAGFAIALTEGDESAISLVWSDEDGYYVFSASKVGTYKFTLTSTKDTSITATLTVNVSEEPAFDISEILNGKYNAVFSAMNTLTAELIFTPASEGATEGTLFYNDLMNLKANTGIYTYKYIDGTVELYRDNGTVMNDLNITIDMLTGALNVGFFACERAEIAADDILFGKYEIGNSMFGLLYEIVFYPDTLEGSNNGFASVVDMNGGIHSGDYTYSYSDGNLVFKHLDGNAAALPISLDAELNLLWNNATNFGFTRVNLDAEDALNGTYTAKNSTGSYVITFDYSNKTMTVSGDISGTYGFTVTDNVVTVANGGPSVTLTPGMIFSKFNGTTTLAPVRVFGTVSSGNSGIAALDGEYYVYNDVEYFCTLVFDKTLGTLTVIDKNGNTTVYNYTATASYATVTLNGESTDISITIGQDGVTAYFQCDGLNRPHPILTENAPAVDTVA